MHSNTSCGKKQTKQKLEKKFFHYLKVLIIFRYFHSLLNSETCLNRTYLAPTFVFKLVQFIQAKLPKISCIGTCGLYRTPVYSGLSLDRFHIKPLLKKNMIWSKFLSDSGNCFYQQKKNKILFNFFISI